LRGRVDKREVIGDGGRIVDFAQMGGRNDIRRRSAANDRFARIDPAERTIELATFRSRG
jgi:hypothetical protein